MAKEKGKLKKMKGVLQEVGMEKFAMETDKDKKNPPRERILSIERMMLVEFNRNEAGECDNIDPADLKKGKKREKVKAGKRMCSVGSVRRGRNWGDYGGFFCCECPYFIPKVKERVSKEVMK